MCRSHRLPFGTYKRVLWPNNKANANHLMMRLFQFTLKLNQYNKIQAGLTHRKFANNKFSIGFYCFNTKSHIEFIRNAYFWLKYKYLKFMQHLCCSLSLSLFLLSSYWPWYEWDSNKYPMNRYNFQVFGSLGSIRT